MINDFLQTQPSIIIRIYIVKILLKLRVCKINPFQLHSLPNLPLFTVSIFVSIHFIKLILYLHQQRGCMIIDLECHLPLIVSDKLILQLILYFSITRVETLRVRIAIFVSSLGIPVKIAYYQVKLCYKHAKCYKE